MPPQSPTSTISAAIGEISQRDTSLWSGGERLPESMVTMLKDCVVVPANQGASQGDHGFLIGIAGVAGWLKPSLTRIDRHYTRCMPPRKPRTTQHEVPLPFRLHHQNPHPCRALMHDPPRPAYGRRPWYRYASASPPFSSAASRRAPEVRPQFSHPHVCVANCTSRGTLTAGNPAKRYAPVPFSIPRTAAVKSSSAHVLLWRIPCQLS